MTTDEKSQMFSDEVFAAMMAANKVLPATDESREACELVGDDSGFYPGGDRMVADDEYPDYQF